MEPIEFKKHEHNMSPGLDSISQHVESCLAWLKRKSRHSTYKDFTQMALDYGMKGTPRFFPLSALSFDLAKDGRFDEYIDASKK